MISGRRDVWCRIITFSCFNTNWITETRDRTEKTIHPTLHSSSFSRPSSDISSNIRFPIGRSPIGRSPIGRSPIGRFPIGRFPIGISSNLRSSLSIFSNGFSFRTHL